ncbi:hypothetical protein L1887_15507 [Cichorium endivia]|nr:hypothetical protein L1887_15507 [Cichorium endivia]
MTKSKILVVGGTGYVGKRIQQGARLVEGSFSDHQSLVDAVKEVDVVICTMSGVQFRSHNILLQLKLVDAIKEAGNVKRFLPSEFGIDPSRMKYAVEYGKETFDDKMTIRKAIEDAKIPYTYISANCLGGYFVGNLSQLTNSLLPPKDRVSIYGDGNREVVFMDEDDAATYTIKSVDDPRTLNKTLYLRPHENILTHNQLVEKWEKLTNKTLQKVHISAQDFLASMKDLDYVYKAAFTRIYKIFYDGCLMNFEIGEGGEEASKLYPEVRYTRMDEYLKRYL